MTESLHSSSWESALMITPPLYTLADLEKIEQVLKAKPAPDFLKQITHAARSYLGYRHLQRTPTHSQKKQAITKLHRQAKALSNQIRDFNNELEHLDDASRLELLHQLPQHGKFEPFEVVKHLALQWAMQDRITLQPFIKALDATLEHFQPGKKGRPAEWALHFFLVRLAYIYRQNTGRDPAISRKDGERFSGPFFRFVLACLKPVAPEWCRDTTRQALGDHIVTSLDFYKQSDTAP